MIRSFSKYGFVHRSLVLCQGAQVKPLRDSFFFPSHVLSTHRPISTSPGHTTPKPSESQMLPTNSRKHKLDLHPSPVKPPPISSNIQPPSPPSFVPPATQLNSKEESTKTSTPDSIVQSARYDYDQAHKHGILAPAPANASKIGKLWHQAKEIFKFYIRGIRLINQHRKRVNAALSRVKSGGEPLSRWEVRFMQTYREDARKLIPFLLILAVIEEIIPLVVLYAPFMLPSTCVLPSQQARILLKRREKIQSSVASAKTDFQRILERGLSSASAIPLQELVAGKESLAMCGALSLFTPSPFKMNRIRRHLQQVAEDDALLIREGMDQRLTLPEMQEALDERGFITNGLDRSAMQRRLRWWLNGVENDFSTWESTSKRALLIARIHAGDVEKQW